MDEIDAALTFFLACCNSAEQLNRQIVNHATISIVRGLVCRVAKESNQTEEGIRALYASFADMVAEQLKDEKELPAKKRH